MEWRRHTAYSLRSGCDRYSISKAMVKEQAKYTAWAAVIPGSPRALHCGTATECMSICDRHDKANLWQKSLEAQQEAVNKMKDWPQLRQVDKNAGRHMRSRVTIKEPKRHTRRR